MSKVPDGYMQKANGHLVPKDLVRPTEMLEDDTVQWIMKYAEALSAQIGRFKRNTQADVACYLDELAEKYGSKRGGLKGNITLTSFDGCKKVVVAVQDNITFGPELQIAKELFDACVRSWAEGSNANIRALVEHAFQVDKEGRINRANVFGLRRLHIEDPIWKRAIDALSDSIRVAGSKEYFRFYRRNSPRDNWEPVVIDLASAVSPTPLEHAIEGAPPADAGAAA